MSISSGTAVARLALGASPLDCRRSHRAGTATKPRLYTAATITDSSLPRATAARSRGTELKPASVSATAGTAKPIPNPEPATAQPADNAGDTADTDAATDGDGDAHYEVKLPDGSVESARTKDDVRVILFKHY